MNKTWVRRQGHFLVVLVFCSCLVGCNPFQPAEYPTDNQRKVANPNSALLGVVMTETDFSKEWIWTDTSIGQDPELPTTDNEYLVETAFSDYAGHYGGRSGPHIDIWHILKRYEQQPLVITPADLVSERTSTKKVLNLTFSQVGQARVSECEKDQTDNKFDLTFCMIVVKYDFINSYLIVTAPDTVSSETLQTIINRVLNGIDSRMRTFAP